MPSPDDQHAVPSPLSAIRRFDVFAEYSRQEHLAKGHAEDEAKGYGVWLAKVVAARRFGNSSAPSGRATRPGRTGEPGAAPKFRSLGDELQTDATFDHDIIDRMGAAFYEDVFVPAIRAARAQSKSYESIREEIRKAWKLAKPTSR